MPSLPQPGAGDTTDVDELERLSKQKREIEKLVGPDRYRGHASKTHFLRAGYTDWNLLPCPLHTSVITSSWTNEIHFALFLYICRT